MEGLSFKEYQKQAATTSVYRKAEAVGGSDLRVLYPSLGLAGETGEVIEKIKKQLRDRKGDFDDPEFLASIGKELGDVLWYHASLCSDLGLDMGAVAVGNLVKLADREKRGKVQGNGDNR